MRITHRSLASAAIALTLGLGATACGSEDTASDSDVITQNDTSAVTTDDVDAVGDDGVAVDSMVGLEVTAVGNVSDLLSDQALRIDRDGLGGSEDQGEVGDELDYDYGYYDYDYYDYDYLTEYDVEFGDDDVVDEGVLVVGAEDVLADRAVDEAVRVSGTIRRYDQDVLESVYDLSLSSDEFDAYEGTLVIVADSVQPAEQQGSATDNAASGAASPSAPSSSDAQSGSSQG